MSQAGWTRGADGVLVNNESGERFELDLRTRPGSGSQRELAVLADQWKVIGVSPTVTTTPPALVGDREYLATYPGIQTSRLESEDAFNGRRLHTKANLMDELAKLKRVIERQYPGAPHESLMVLDAPTGQNGFAQAQMFHEAIGLTGVCLTKLDGTAKGGIVVRIVRELKLPIKLIGVGERVEDLQAFDPVAFVDALVPAE